jgi:hypothetical protein
MQVKSTIIALMLSTLLCTITSNKTNAQAFCAGETIIWSENFGTGTTASNNADVINISYQATGALNDGFYRVINSTQQRTEWHNSPDHTIGDVNGKMLVVNGSGQTFYSKILTNGTTGFLPGSYAASLFLMNLNKPGTCGASALLPTFSFKAEYSTSADGNNFINLQTVNANAVPQSATPTWIQLGGLFNIPATALRVRLTLINATLSGCGNDYAIDDIQFGACPSGGPLPVDFLNITAAQKGGAVAINWSTASENNNSYFDVEKSFDGSNFTTINSVKGAGNSSTLKNYGSYDAKPVAGYNYYRIRQVDFDGKFKFSDVVKVKISFDKTGVSVLTNPFVNNITVDFVSPANQRLNIKLTDISGKLIATEFWNISKGSSRVVFSKVTNLKSGMYIFIVTDNDGAVIYNNKLVKQ